MYKYNKLLLVMLVITLLVSLFTISASATGIEDGTVVEDTTTVTEDLVATEEDTNSGVVEENTSTDYSSSLEETNIYLKYITGFLLFIVICILFHYAYKFFNLFF